MLRLVAFSLTLTVLYAYTPCGSAQGQDVPKLVPVTLPTALKTTYLKRVTIERAESGKLVDIVKKLAIDHRLRLDIDAAVLMPIQNETVHLIAQRDARLDILLSDLLREASRISDDVAGPYCIVRKDLLVITTAEQATIKKNGALVCQVLRQPPDASYTKLVRAIQARLTRKVDVEGGEVSLPDLLQKWGKDHDLGFTVDQVSFLANGITNLGEARPTLKAGKKVALESVIRGAFRSIDADLYLDPYGRLRIVHKKTYELLPKKK